jgi:hypothetical protein
MRALYPTSNALPGIADTGIDDFLRRYRRESSRVVWAGLVLGAIVFSFAPFVTIGIPLPSFWLSRKSLDRYADLVTRHPVYLVRQLVFLVKVAAGLCWGAHHDVRARFGLAAYPPDPGTWRTQ